MVNFNMSDDDKKSNDSEQKSQTNQLWMEGSTDTILTAAKKKKNN